MELKKQVRLQIEELEQRIAPSGTGNPGNNNPPRKQHQQFGERGHRRPGLDG
jgi:hypothetical protein